MLSYLGLFNDKNKEKSEVSGVQVSCVRLVLVLSLQCLQCVQPAFVQNAAGWEGSFTVGRIDCPGY